MKSAQIVFLVVAWTVATPQFSVGQVTTKVAATDVLKLQTHADLVARDLGIAPGEITVEVYNRGAVQVAKDIKVDFYVANAKIGSRVVPQPLNGKEGKKASYPISQTQPCASREVKVVIDPTQQIDELYDDNNTAALNALFPCPDLAVDSIKKNWNDLHTEYVAEVKLINKGNAPVGYFYILATTHDSAIFGGLDGWLESRRGPLAVGQKEKFTVGQAFGYQDMKVKVWIDRHDQVKETDENNNKVEKTLD